MRISTLALLGYSLLGASLSKAARFEAEDGVLTGVTVATAQSGYTGRGYVTGFDAASDKVAITVTASSSGVYVLTIRFRSPSGEKKTTVSVNGAGLGEVTLASTTAFTDVSAGKVMLNSGSNTVTLENNWGWYEIDSVSVDPAPTSGGHSANGELVNPNASSEAKGLNRYLQNVIYAKKILSGQQEIQYADWLQTNVGKSPAIIGLDLMDYSPSRVERGTVGVSVEESISYDAKGGIVTLVWHWNAPTGLIDQPGKEWYRGFYTDSTTFDVAAALANKSGSNYQLLIRDIDAIAVQLKRLQDKKIPILWRPLHESVSGGWFWWSAKGAGPVKELWRILYDRLTNYHKVNNLIWVWNSPESAYYPGDDVVDILTYDSYPSQGDHGPVSSTYDQLISIGKDKKVVALGEVGSIPDPDLLVSYKIDWAWFVTWGGDFITNNAWNPLSFLKKVYSHSYVITLDEVGNFKGTPANPTTTNQPTTTTTKPPTTTTTAGGAQQTAWGQCGGEGYTGPTACVSGYKCQYSSQWYSQCVPA